MAIVRQEYKMDHHNSDGSGGRRHVTERCLVAADVDKTILAQTSGERSHFLRRVAPQLLESAKLGMKLAFVTGNSMSELTSRFLRWLIEHLCYTDDLALLPQFHFFCNSGGVYFQFPEGHDTIAGILRDYPTGQSKQVDTVFSLLTENDAAGTTFVRPAFVDANYLARTQIPSDDVHRIRTILDESGGEYLRGVRESTGELARSYDLSKVMTAGALDIPSVDSRPVEFVQQGASQIATVQLTLKPILSFRHGLDAEAQARLFEKDLRTEVTARVQQGLDAAGLGHYVARPGGRSSIDVTLEKLSKAYAMEFLIDRLNLQGHERQGQRFGANAVYFGDEVIVGGGNDYAVTRIPGLLVFAVNPDKALIPFLSHVFVPSSILEGPEATADVLDELNRIARLSLASWKDHEPWPRGCSERGSAIDCFKIKVFGERIHAKVNRLRNSGKLTPDEWQTLHAFVTLMNRDDVSARHWLSILIDELDAIMTELSQTPRPSQAAIGTSHPDN